MWIQIIHDYWRIYESLDGDDSAYAYESHVQSEEDFDLENQSSSNIIYMKFY